MYACREVDYVLNQRSYAFYGVIYQPSFTVSRSVYQPHFFFFGVVPGSLDS
jgi:hypothetical protein